MNTVFSLFVHNSTCRIDVMFAKNYAENGHDQFYYNAQYTITVNVCTSFLMSVEKSEIAL